MKKILCLNYECKLMKKFIEKIVVSLPYWILLLPAFFVMMIIKKINLSFEQYLNILQVLIWPIIVIISLFFFKKVFTYLFFSMEEFNFFGTKGRLKDIKEVIEERVEERIAEESKQRVTQIEREQFYKELAQARVEIENTKKSKADADKEAGENLDLAKKIFEKYDALLKDNIELTKELNKFRRRQEERNSRITALKEKIRQADTIDSGEKENVPKASKSL